MDDAETGSHARAPAPIPATRTGTRTGTIATWLLRAYLGFAVRTTRWRIEGAPDTRTILTAAPGSARGGAAVAFWHATLPLTPALWFWARRIEPALRLHAIISRNRDGRLISDIVAPWGISGIAGSTARRGKDKGGAQALRRATQLLRRGEIVGITPDGPRGPARQAQDGALVLARLGRRPIVPLGGATSGLRLQSWDAMKLPRPFGRGVLVCGASLPAISDIATLTGAVDRVTEAAEARLAAMRPLWRDRAWQAFGVFAAPALIGLIQRRILRGRERPARRRERMGFASLPRPQGRVLWLHAASVGEAISLRPLLDALHAADPTRCLLVTTATVTGADVIEAHTKRADSQILHQFIPFDVPRWVGRFLDHWRPEAAILIESEIWPGLLGACRMRDIPVGIVNGRMSEQSWERWQKIGRLSRAYFGDVTWVAARGVDDAARFTGLGARNVETLGDLKHAAPPLDATDEAIAYMREWIGTRPVWLCAATHPGEEALIRAAAIALRAHYPDLLTIVAPRHPPRGAEVASLLDNAPRRSLGGHPNDRDAFWVIDTLGELGALYRVCRIVFMGNSLRPAPSGGGHNPYEPARLGAAVLSGRRIGNFADAYAGLGDAAMLIDDDDLATGVRALLDDPARVADMGRAGIARAATGRDTIAGLVRRIAALARS